MMLFISVADLGIVDFVHPDVPNSDCSYSSAVVGSPDVDGSPSIRFLNIGNHDFFFSASIFNLNV